MSQGLEKYDWQQIAAQLDDQGYATLPGVLGGADCRTLADCFTVDTLFRSHIRMQRHGFGAGEYKYFDYALPQLIESLRQQLYDALAPIANAWSVKLRQGIIYPAALDDFLDACHRAGQLRPTPLILRYGVGDYNRLHQDLYGALSFPLQTAVLLDQPGVDFAGGEFVLTEQKPRAQSRVHVVPLAQGDGVIFAVNDRPALGQRGYFRLKMRHGVSDIRRGHRHTLGIIFHDAT